MYRIVRLIPSVAVCAICLSIGTATASSLSQELIDQVAALRDDDTVSVLFVMREDVDGKTLKHDLAAARLRSARHQTAITALRETARNSQKAVLAKLSVLKSEGRANAIKSYWIGNFISAELAVSALDDMLSFPDIAAVIPFPQVENIRPIEMAPQISRESEGGNVAEPGLRVVGADQMWAMGYTGRGRLIANLDTGVDGEHPALSSRWRGNLGWPEEASWYDPVFGLPAPYDIQNRRHGTLTMGLLCGADPSTGDTTGVAPDAEWIAAGIIDIPGANIIEALQWFADPDGDPNTVGDVPDVLCNSWGIPAIPASGFSCEDIFWSAIDNLEACGVITIWAAGNEGNRGAESIRNPSNRATTPVNTFCVGMIDGNDPAYPLHNLSSRGPSVCDGISIKPEVVAPGVQPRTTLAGGGYTTGFLGSSLAAPHVAGAALLLRQYNPDATVDEVKFALLNSAVDLGDVGADNDYGAGLIDIPAAMALLPAPLTPVIRIVREYYDRPAPGGSTDLIVVLGNGGVDLGDVQLSIVSMDDRLTIISGSAAYGTIVRDDTVSNDDTPFMFSVSADALPGDRIPFQFVIDGAGGYHQELTGFVQVAAGLGVGDRVVTHDVGPVRFSVGDDGAFGFHPDGFHARSGGVGFEHISLATGPVLFEMGLLIGTGPANLSDNVRGVLDARSEFRIDPSGGIVMMEPGTYADEETYSAYTDADAANPLGLFIQQRTYAWSNAESVLMTFTVHNRSGTEIHDLHVGLFSDWDFPWGNGSLDWGKVLPDDQLGYMRKDPMFAGIPTLTAVGVVSAAGLTDFHYFRNGSEIYGPPQGDGFTKSEKWAAMTGGVQMAVNPSGDASMMCATGPYDLDTGGVFTVAFAVIGTADEIDLPSRMTTSRTNYDGIPLVGRPGDVNRDGWTNLADIVAMVDFLYRGSGAPFDRVLADVDRNCRSNIIDLVVLINHVFRDGERPLTGCLP